ncbi:unnamed protein product [Ilex paraguariensis]|uniref:BIG2 domain-containing protein n=1 Tax=Ilex paraguariensis TaxID=185542 RepID=A0ABC8U326_9AQUA
MFRLVSLTLFQALLVLMTATESLSVSGPHIADVNILLPPKMTHAVEYRLLGSDGCFRWSWDHHDILSVLPEYNFSSQCSTSARLRSIAPYDGRKKTAVYATDVQTGMVIRCKVYIDNLSRIQIFHNSIKLDLDGLATLRVRAFDNEENVFSSLVGLQFMWQLMPETDGLPHHLVHVPLKDSPLSDCGGFCGDLDIQIRLEDGGVFSDLYLVKGTGIGREIVSVHLLEPQLEHMADKIVLTVAEAMSLEPPSPVFVLIGAIVHYSLKVIHGNVPQVVTLPSPFHRWSVLNSSVSQVDTMMGKAHALNLGFTTIVVEDTRVADHGQMSSLHVVLPDALYLYVLPLSPLGDPVEGIEPVPSGSRWYVVSGRQYLIQIKAFSRGPWAQQIYLTESDDVKLVDSKSKYWNTFPVSDSIAVRHGWNSGILQATSYGLGRLTATLAYSEGDDETKKILSVKQEVMVCDQVKFSLDTRTNVSRSIVLPWAPAVYQEVELKATGGCAKASSDYKWFSSDLDTVSVSTYGIVQAKRPGKATIRAVSIFDSFNYDEVLIEVSIPSAMVMRPNFPVEIVVGSPLQASVTLKTSDGAYYFRCDAFSSSVRWKTGGESFAIVNATGESFVLDKQEIDGLHTLHGPPCAWTYVYASGSGRTMLHATLAKEYQHFDRSFSGPIDLKATSPIAAYLPLIVHQANDGNQYGGYWFDLAQAEAHNQLDNLESLNLAPGTHLDVMLRGGPERWEGVDFVEDVETLDEEHTLLKVGILVHQQSTSYGSLYRILCQKSGTFILVFKRGNLVGGDHPLPAVEEVELSLTCSVPSSILLIADEAVNSLEVIWAAIQADHSLGRIRASPVTVANGHTIRVSAVGISDSGKAFGNSSSLCLRWELNNCDGLAFWDDLYITKSSWERFLVLQNSSGLCIVRATVAGYTDITSSHHSTTPFEIPENVLTDAIRLQLVSSLRVTPEFNLLFFSHVVRLNLSITGGSCFLNTLVNDTQVVEIIQPPPGLQCSQLVLAPKGLGVALVTVYDIGLDPPLAASSVVQVADVDWIKITSPKEISLMEGSVQSINISAGASDGSTFDSSQLVYMSTRVHIEDDIVELADNYDLFSPVDGYVKGSTFTIQARHLGFTTLYVSATQQSGREILSQPVKVEVYKPPSIHPNDIFLVPGASYVLTVRGGPTIGAHVEYASMDDESAKMNKSSGLLSAISPGNTTLVATVYGPGHIMMCQAYGRVTVGVPFSVILSVQSKQLAVGREMPIYPSLSEGNLFSFYELCKNYKWTVEDEEVLSFQVADHLLADELAVAKEFRSTGYLDEQDLGFIQVLYGRSAGRTDVSVSFSCDFISSGSFSQSMLYSASISLWVVPDLPLALGAVMTWVLPPHYTTSNLLPSSSKLYSQGDALSHKGTIAYSLLRECGRKTEEAKNDAIAIDGSKIRTKGSNNIACIQAKDRSTGRTEVASCVRVAEVSQIRITTKMFPIHIINLAVDAELDLPIIYCDILGTPFHEAYNVSLFDAETNFPDVLSINGTHDNSGYIHLKAISQGRALLRIALDSNSEKSDYMMISVGARLYPQNPVLHLGSCLNFSIEDLNNHVSGQWLSGNASVLAVDPQSGNAEAVGEGTAQVIFDGSNLKLQTTVTVLKGNIVSVHAPKETLTNVPFPLKGYSFSVGFNDSYDHKYEADGNGRVVYDCRVEPSFVGYAKPWRDLDTGNSYCLFFPYSPEHLVRSIPKSGDTRQDISVSINASLRGANHISGSASALFIGGFSLLEMDKNSLQVNLTPHSNKSIITIVGNTDIEIHWQDRDLLLIRPIHKEEDGIGSHAQYEVKVLRAERFKDKVIITLPATGQRVEVNVNYDPGERAPGERAPATTTSNVTIWAGLVGGLALLILTLAVFICFLDRPVRSRPSLPSLPPATPSAPAPVTPDRRIPAVSNEQSPRTPQPFIDYVRRTIDETPYYKQEARRRFNPQHTF